MTLGCAQFSEWHTKEAERSLNLIRFITPYGSLGCRQHQPFIFKHNLSSMSIVGVGRMLWGNDLVPATLTIQEPSVHEQE